MMLCWKLKKVLHITINTYTYKKSVLLVLEVEKDYILKEKIAI